MVVTVDADGKTLELLFLHRLCDQFCYCYGLLCIIMSIDLLAPVLCSHHCSHSLREHRMAFSFFVSIVRSSEKKMPASREREKKGPIFLSFFSFFVSINIFRMHTNAIAFVLYSIFLAHRPSTQQITFHFSCDFFGQLFVSVCFCKLKRKQPEKNISKKKK